MMKSTSTITQQEMEQIIELDGLNMAPVMALQGIVFDPQRRQKGLVEEIQKGAEFLFAGRAGRIVGYIEYFPRQKDVHVASIQVHPEYQQGGILRNLLAGAAEVAKRLKHHTFTTSVHHGNPLSLKLHKTLGFVQTGRTDERVLFEIPAEKLYNALNRYKVKRTLSVSYKRRKKLKF
jgi:ribosomal protein S18 acetylase RimI-like enzyme